ncbi:MAG: hypothetical protein N7Q72_07505, partial [Spiroplasma sp. Tabriz.8]|nr:hypothetical protein [Spiroplasma sp. Tabriz.8]
MRINIGLHKLLLLILIIIIIIIIILLLLQFRNCILYSLSSLSSVAWCFDLKAILEDNYHTKKD